ncbi:MAG: hypothetical protein M3R51_07940 [Candidatus Eremiobacteraeota bacterium]|nr:hypothetical protein [Candidatus Eremiobacteraeota bacterium]
MFEFELVTVKLEAFPACETDVVNPKPGPRKQPGMASHLPTPKYAVCQPRAIDPVLADRVEFPQPGRINAKQHADEISAFIRRSFSWRWEADLYPRTCVVVSLLRVLRVITVPEPSGEQRAKLQQRIGVHL